jgi:nucleoside-diphosphate-sugar epimerase
VARHIPDLNAVNASNHRIRDLVQGKLRDSLPPTAPVFTFVDVRDVALAHVRAMMLPEAGGQRFYVVGGYFSNKRIVDIMREEFPWLEYCLPGREVEDDFPEDVYGFDNGRSRRVLGLEYRGLRESVVDTVRSMLGSVSELLDEKAKV